MPGVVAVPLASKFPVAASILSAFAANGLHKILVMSVSEDDRPVPHASTLPNGARPRSEHRLDGFVQATATTLASREPDGVMIVQASPPRPDPDRLRGLPVRSGLWELIHEAYLCDLTPDRTARFGLADWLEILDAQRRSGDLLLRTEDGAILVRFDHGSIQAVDCSASAFATESAESGSAGERIAHMLSARHSEFRFMEGAPSLPPEVGGARSCLDDMLGGRLRGLLPHPYLTEQIARHVTDTSLPNLKRITAGAGTILTRAFRRPLELLLSRLGLRFALVLIDATTVTSAGSVAMLAGIADATLLVAGVTGLESAGLVRAVAELRRGGSTKVAVLLIPPNGVPEAAR